MKKFLFKKIVPKETAWMLLLVGIGIILYTLVTIQSILTAGAVGYIQLLSGLLLLIWGITEILPKKHKSSVATLRITILAICVVILYYLARFFRFWWAMQ